MPRKTAGVGALFCAKCSGTDLTIIGAGNTRLVRGKKRRATHVRCRCGHEWFSIHPEALAKASEADRAAKAKLEAEDDQA